MGESGKYHISNYDIGCEFQLFKEEGSDVAGCHTSIEGNRGYLTVGVIIL